MISFCRSTLLQRSISSPGHNKKTYKPWLKSITRANWSEVQQDIFIYYPPTYQTSLNVNCIHKGGKSPPCEDCWLGFPASMINERWSSLIIHTCPGLVLWLVPHASPCMLIMEMSQSLRPGARREYLSAVRGLQTLLSLCQSHSCPPLEIACS